MTNLSEIPYFDGHCDTVWRCMQTGPVAEYGDTEQAQRAYFAASRDLRENTGHLDLLRSSRYGRRAQFFALYDNAAALPPGQAWPRLCAMHRWFESQLSANGDLAALCRTGREVDDAVSAGKTAALLSIEGADLLDCEVENLYTVDGWGVRLLNPVWNNANLLSGSCAQDADRGLSPQGRDFLRHMEELGVYADVSHLSDPGFWDVMRLTRRPVVASHSNARALCPHRRNLTDDMFRAIRDTGGVVGINLYYCFVGGPSMDDLTAHIEHFLSLNGEKTVAIGGDLDGCEMLAAGMTGVESVVALYDALVRRGYGKDLLTDIFWNNWRRLL